MLTVLIGAVLNILLDPIFIFVLKMGVQGAALATVISQFVSVLWVLRFLTGNEAVIRLKKDSLKVHFPLLKEIVALGTSGFVMSFTNSAVQIVCNATLQNFGGESFLAGIRVRFFLSISCFLLV